MISQFLSSVNVKNGSEIWLGGRQMDFHNFNWGDGSLFNYSYWDQGEPSFPAEKCIEMSWRNGRWNDINCRLKRAVLCERQISTRHAITKPNLYQSITCLESNCTSSSTSGMTAVNGAPGGSQFNTSANEQQSAIADQQVLEQTNRTSSSVLNSSTSSSPDEGNFMLPPDDRPIKVITSIMNREPQVDVSPESASSTRAPVEAYQSASNKTSQATNNSTSLSPLSAESNSTSPQQLSANSSTTSTNTVDVASSQANGSSFVHYNLPTPERSFEVDQLHQIPNSQTYSPLSPKNDNVPADTTQQTVTGLLADAAGARDPLANASSSLV